MDPPIAPKGLYENPFPKNKEYSKNDLKLLKKENENYVEIIGKVIADLSKPNPDINDIISYLKEVPNINEEIIAKDQRTEEFLANSNKQIEQLLKQIADLEEQIKIQHQKNIKLQKQKNLLIQFFEEDN